MILVHVALLSFIKLKIVLFLSDLKIINKLGRHSTKISSQDERVFKFGACNFVSEHTGLTSRRRGESSICMIV